MTTVLDLLKIMKIDRNWTHIGLYGLRIKRFESPRCYDSNGTPPDSQNCRIKFKIQQKSNGPHRPNCPLNLAINRIKSLLQAEVRRVDPSRLSLKPGRFVSKLVATEWTFPYTFDRVRFDLGDQRNGSEKMDLGSWVKAQYADKSPVFRQKPSIRVEAQYSGSKPSN